MVTTTRSKIINVTAHKAVATAKTKAPSRVLPAGRFELN